MSSNEYLTTLLEISIGLIGFAGVVAALGRSKLSASARSFRVTLLLLYSSVCMIAASLPLLLVLSSLSEQIVWRLSAGVFAACHILVFCWSALRVGQLNRDGQLPRWLSASAGVIVIVTVVLLLNITLVNPENSDFLYVSAATLTTLLCVYHFFMLVSSIDHQRGAT